MPFKKILCPTDFSEDSFKALRKAVELVSDSNAEICVIHVDSPAPKRVSLDVIANYAHTEAERRADTVANLCAVLTENVPDSVRARPLLKTGDAAEQIVQAAREENADLIVLTTHGAGGAETHSLGNVAESVLRSAPCLVMSLNVRSSAQADLAGSNGSSHSYDNLPAAIETVSNKALFLDGD